MKKKAKKPPFSIMPNDDAMQEMMAAKAKGKTKGKGRAIAPRTKPVSKKKAKKHSY